MNTGLEVEWKLLKNYFNHFNHIRDDDKNPATKIVLSCFISQKLNCTSGFMAIKHGNRDPPSFTYLFLQNKYTVLQPQVNQLAR